jgi:hypothetical protein
MEKDKGCRGERGRIKKGGRYYEWIVEARWKVSNEWRVDDWEGYGLKEEDVRSDIL